MSRYGASLLVYGLLLLACGGSTAPVGDAGLDAGGGTDAIASDAPAGDSGGGACDGGACAFGLHCCADACVNELNDPLNCGGCGHTCSGAASMCLGGSCTVPTCSPACASGQQCCAIQGPGPSGPPQCVTGTTCPVGCPTCN